jgi:hypothetical protein
VAIAGSPPGKRSPERWRNKGAPMFERAVDSRKYIVSIELRSAADCPNDFRLPAAAAAFDAGIFLPRDDPDWFGQYAYPPRMLLLAGDTLWLMPHPSANERAGLCGLEHISSVESGHMLLKGWLAFRGVGFDYAIPYNTRGQPTVLRFMRKFRTAWLGSGELVPGGIAMGDDLDVRFANALEDELDPEETVAVKFFQRGRQLKRRWTIRRTTQSLPGDLLVLTNKRVIWITDRERGAKAQFGTISTYAPFRTLRAARLVSKGNKCFFQLDLPGTRCLVPVGDGYTSEGEAFAGRTCELIDVAPNGRDRRASEDSNGRPYGADLARLQ